MVKSMPAVRGGDLDWETGVELDLIIRNLVTRVLVLRHEVFVIHYS